MAKEIERFEAQAEDGRIFTLIVNQEFIDARSHDGPGNIRGLQEIVTAEGYHVNQLRKDTYWIVERKLTVMKVVSDREEG